MPGEISCESSMECGRYFLRFLVFLLQCVAANREMRVLRAFGLLRAVASQAIWNFAAILRRCWVWARLANLAATRVSGGWLVERSEQF